VMQTSAPVATSAPAAASVAAPEAATAAAPDVAPAAIQAPAPAAQTAVAAPLTAPVAAPVAATSAAATVGMPSVSAYQLPISDLLAVAEGSGLQWVNSNAEKVAAVQAAIAAEPKPVHVPRERAPLVVLDEGPLILVETKRDLRQMALPTDNDVTA